MFQNVSKFKLLLRSGLLSAELGGKRCPEEWADTFLGKFWPVHACEWGGIEWDGEGIPIISQS